MNYKELFRRLVALIASPKKTWVEISAETPRRDVMAAFVYPLIAVGGLVVLADKLLHGGVERVTFHAAMMDVCGYCIAFFGGFFLAAWLLDTLRQKFLGHAADMAGSQLFVGYAMGIVFVADILSVVFPQFFMFWWLMQFYVLYVVWEGSDVLFCMSDEKRLTFTTLTALAVVFAPTLIRALFNMLSNTLG